MTELLYKELLAHRVPEGRRRARRRLLARRCGGRRQGERGSATATPEGYNPSLTRLDSWLRINEDNTVNVLTSQGDPGSST